MTTHGSRFRRLRAVLATLLAGLPVLAGGVVLTPPAEARPARAVTVAADGREPCDKVAGLVWISSAYALTFIPPVTFANPLVLAGYAAYIGFTARCYQFAPDGSKATVLTLDYLMSEIEKATGRQLAQAQLDGVLARAGDLYTTLERESSNLQNLEHLTPAERGRLATIMQTIGNDASLLEAEFDNLGWQSLPGVAMVAGLKHAAYLLSYSLSEDGAYRRHLERVVFAEERNESIDRLAQKEAGLVRYVQDDLTMVRESTTKTSSGMVPTTWFTIDAAAKRGDHYLYQRAWDCERRWRPKKECTNFEDRRTEFFTAVSDANADARSEVAELLDPGYLAVKNALSTYRGASFRLMNNRVDSPTAQTVLEGKCLDLPGSGATAPSGTLVQQSTCEGTDVATSSDQVWRQVRGSGQLENVRTGLCLDVLGSPSGQVDGSRVTVATCANADDESTEHADQRWGVHPLGYLVNLATGRCLDMAGTGTTVSGATAQVSQCRHDRSAGTLNNRTQPARGASAGALPTDAATDQTWTLWYLGEPMPSARALPAAPPVRTLPVAVADEVTVAQDSTGSELDVLANDPVPAGDPRFVLSVTAPLHGRTQLVPGGGAVRYSPDAGYCNDKGGLPPDSFAYTVNGGSTATVTVTVACAAVDSPPVAIDDRIVVGQDSSVATVDVLANDTDSDGGPRRVLSVTAPSDGVASVVEDGSGVTYRPDRGYCNDRASADRFDYTVNGGAVATVTVVVTCADTVPPETTITTRANIFGQTSFGSHRARLDFSSPEPGATFQCRLDSAPFAPCVSGAEFHLPRGRHVFEVRAADAAGNVDPSPARRVIRCNALF